MDILHSYELATEANARAALKDLFDAISPTERRRVWLALYMQSHGHHPPTPIDWSDSSGDGDLKIKPPMAAVNGQ